MREGEDQLSLRYDIDPDTRKMAIVNHFIGNITKEDIARIDYRINQKEQVVRSIPGKLMAKQWLTLLSLLTVNTCCLLKRFSDGSQKSSAPVAFGVYNHPDWLNDIGIYQPTDPAPALEGLAAEWPTGAHLE